MPYLDTGEAAAHLSVSKGTSSVIGLGSNVTAHECPELRVPWNCVYPGPGTSRPKSKDVLVRA
jgi:hypothetical protein